VGACVDRYTNAHTNTEQDVDVYIHNSAGINQNTHSNQYASTDEHAISALFHAGADLYACYPLSLGDLE
jgi:hypothetical protein